MRRYSEIAKFFVSSLVLSVLLGGSCSAAEVGVYYFPGWKDGAVKARPDPWRAIRSYPEREPYVGWYREGDLDVMRMQVSQMQRGGIDFVVFDWYWNSIDGVFMNHSVDAFLKVGEKSGIKFALLWANHFDSPVSKDEFGKMVGYWLDHYLASSSYYSIQGKPVVMVFSPDRFEVAASKFGSSTADLIRYANAEAVKKGVPGIYFIAASHAVERSVNGELPSRGYSAVSAYNYHFGLSGKIEERPLSHSYRELSDGYRETWSWFVRKSKLPYILPLTVGWDKRPWGGSADSQHDQSFSTPEEFRAHLQSAKVLLDKYPEVTLGTAIICCWNEFGEGSYIEPTKKYGFDYVDAVKSVFKGK